ncbi:MAG: acyl carrier protein [Parachlamydiaceae bacterium]|nr:acyl carrier protein [Parachlamydiaceae bacterium]
MSKEREGNPLSIEQEVIDIVVEQLGVDRNEVKPESSFVEDLNADSLDLTELIMTLEESFGCEISPEDSANLKTIRDVITYLEKRQAE